MRTTVRISDDLLVEAKKAAAEEGRTLAQVMEDALREALVRRSAPVEAKTVRVPTFGRGGLQPGVDLDDSATLLDLMDAGEGAPSAGGA